MDQEIRHVAHESSSLRAVVELDIHHLGAVVCFMALQETFESKAQAFLDRVPVDQRRGNLQASDSDVIHLKQLASRGIPEAESEALEIIGAHVCRVADRGGHGEQREKVEALNRHDPGIRP